jgi:hypothetical protein
MGAGGCRETDASRRDRNSVAPCAVARQHPRRVRGARGRSLVVKSLVAELRKDEAGPWAAFGKTGTAITQRQVANLLAAFNIHPKTMHVAGMADAKGYELAQFADAFERYVPVSIRPPVLCE